MAQPLPVSIRRRRRRAVGFAVLNARWPSGAMAAPGFGDARRADRYVAAGKGPCHGALGDLRVCGLSPFGLRVWRHSSQSTHGRGLQAAPMHPDCGSISPIPHKGGANLPDPKLPWRPCRCWFPSGCGVMWLILSKGHLDNLNPTLSFSKRRWKSTVGTRLKKSSGYLLLLRCARCAVTSRGR
ncbi:unnamed protein product [Prorocentrum cordatum]|uniref:Uncharacterized protein n=1 Tax=Prorocentrum cordatum TaxID=2364126 RepID=A0ABN9SYQ5_9DINO|nr:unnamed protein product [Polarella glacialis]